MEQALRWGLELVVLPEYFCAMGKRDSDKLAYCEAYGRGPIQESMACAAREQLWVVAGTLPQADDAQHVFNSSSVYSPDGRMRPATTRFTSSITTTGVSTMRSPMWCRQVCSPWSAM